jgi:penicillin-binding protein 2
VRGGRNDYEDSGARSVGEGPGSPTSVLTRSGAAGERTRLVRLPRPRPIVEPISHAEMGYFRSGGFYLRVSVLGVAALALFGVLALRLWSLQVLNGRSYVRAAREQTFRFVDLPTPRGPILDARGSVVAGTTGRLVVQADADALGGLDAHGRWQPERHGRRALAALSAVTGIGVQKLIARVRASVAKDPHAPAVVVRRLTRRLSFYLEEHASRYAGLSVDVVPERSYPQRALGSEFIGLLGEVSPEQLKRRRYRADRAGEVIGQSGVEATYDRLLNVGLQRARVAVDSLGRTTGRLHLVGLRTPRHGLKLTIDMRIQRAAVRAIRDGIALAHVAGHPDADAGAAVVLNAKTGAVVALASSPTFSEVAAARDPKYLARLLRAGPHAPPLLNRATQGLYPTGSTFKPIVAEAALAAGLITPYTYKPCTGALQVGGFTFHNVEPGINAALNLRQALAISCDTWFYRLGTEFYWRQQAFGALDMQRWAMRLGLGHPTGFDVPGEAGGVVPTPSWLRRTFQEPWQRIWFEGYSVNLSIGQGYLAVTPLQLAVAYAALANGGTVVTPHVGGAVVDPYGHVLQRLAHPAKARLRLVDSWAIRDGLYAAAHEKNGTSSMIFRDFPVAVAGKTGTAQAPPGSDHSWYASWAPAYHPRYVVVVLIEHGGFGAEAAAPAARDIYQALFHVRPARARAGT